MLKKIFSCAAVTVIILLSLTGCRDGIKKEPVATATPVETTEAVPETTEMPTEPAEKWLKDNVEGKVCVGFVPTTAGNWRYAVIEDQEAAVAAFEKATSAIYSDEWWIKGDKTTGLFVEYNGEIWDFVESGELVCSLGRVKAEDAADLYALCAEAAKAAGWKDAVKPEQLSGIVSATLRSGETEIPLTDTATLKKLEEMLTDCEFYLGMPSCPLTALLDLETEAGEILILALATDGCGIWMSEGSCYDFGSDSQPLYDLFGVTLEMGRLIKKG